MQNCCYLCGDEIEPLFRVCRCDFVVHDRCFDRLVNEVSSHSIACPVCLTKYSRRANRCAIVKIIMLSMMIFTSISFTFLCLWYNVRFFVFAFVYTTWLLLQAYLVLSRMNLQPSSVQGAEFQQEKMANAGIEPAPLSLTRS